MSQSNPQPDPTERLIKLGDVVRMTLKGLDPENLITHVTQLVGTEHACVITHSGFRSLPIHRSKFTWNDTDNLWSLSF